MLVHICCSVDSHFFLEKLQNDFPNEKLIGFFYDPNIHPYSEYKLRLLDVKRSCDSLGIELLEGEYDFETWLDLTRGLEKEPEKGKRCELCFDLRFEVSAKKALELGENKITTTLLVSPLKSQTQLQKSGNKFFEQYGVEFIFVDYRTFGGSNLQSVVSKEKKLYRQDYCGCMYGLTNQREAQNIFLDEMISPINRQLLPASIEHRLEIYSKRIELEKSGVDYHIKKEKFLNYRLLNFKFYDGKKQILEAYLLNYSTLKRGKAQGRIETTCSGVSYLNREEVKLITVEHFNTLANTSFKETKELTCSPISFEDELHVRAKIAQSFYDLSPIIVVDSIPKNKITIEIDSKVYEDVKETILEV
ncbi:MAG: epoxyqueuosine reductase QueH [Campylobacterota bacterium]|nr:epoxyqueuosine reductase QueH [Campylobacterota bacterium]